MSWKEQGDALVQDFEFKDFAQAFSFMTEVAFAAEKQNHHPNWSNVWNKVNIKLSTHDAGNVVTDKDYTLAETISEIYKKFD